MTHSADIGLGLQGVFLLLLLGAAVMDVRLRRVPNLLCGALLGAGLLAAALGVSAVSVTPALLGILLGLAIWLPFWLLGLLGAGDVKFFAAACAWLGPSMAWRASLAVAVLAGLMAALVMARRRGLQHVAEFSAVGVSDPGAMLRSAAAAPAGTSHGDSFPYAVPMAIVAALALLQPSLFQ